MCLTGLQQDVDILHYEKMEAVVGENVTLPCIIQSSPSLTIVSVEWRKNKSGNTKLAVYSPNLGLWKFWPNVTMQNVPNGSYLHLHDVETWDSGFYICEIATYPLGAIRSETELKIKGKTKRMRRSSQWAQNFIFSYKWAVLSCCLMLIFHFALECIRAHKPMSDLLRTCM